MASVLARGGAPAAAVAVYAWWASALRPFSDASLVAVLGGGVAAMAAGAVWLPTVRLRHVPTLGLLLWLLLVVGLAAWELASYLQHPRSEHPTLSSIANDVLAPHPVRALTFAVWLLGAALLGRR